MNRKKYRPGINAMRNAARRGEFKVLYVHGGERKDLVHTTIQEVGVDVTIKRVLWVKARPDYEPLFSI